MKELIFVGLIILVFALSLPGFFVQPTFFALNKSGYENEVFVCKQDSDCFKVSEGCGCGSGGANTSINQSYYWENIAFQQKGHLCAGPISDHLTFSEKAKPRCVFNTCKLTRNY